MVFLTNAKLSGLVKVENGDLVVRNQIYHDAFSMTWVKEHTAVNWQLLVTIASLAIELKLSVGTRPRFEGAAADQPEYIAHRTMPPIRSTPTTRR